MTLVILAPCCFTVSFPVLSKLLRGADSEGSWQISAQESCTNSLRLSVFEWSRLCRAGRVISCAHCRGWFFGCSGALWKGGSWLICLGMVVKGRGVSRPRPSCCSLCWECLIGKVFCLGCKQSWVRVGLEALGSESGSFGCVSSYQVVGNRNLLLWLFF